ncbi:MAG: AMIN domain-containing protein [Desulfobacterales bacterium]|nr:AMIN domain-containing protein [Deltaproteobacteria bacterium]NNK93572.1 AMIN domain-containing protein [Desulfobacterales bacterium]
MKRLLPIVMIYFLIPITCIMASAESHNKGAVLESITYEKGDLNQERVLFKLNGIHTPKVFKIKGEKPRLVFDFLDTGYSGPVNRLKDTNGKLVKGVRIGIHNNPPKTRVVIDLAVDEEYQFSEDFVVQENLLTVIISPIADKQQGKEPPAAEIADQKPEPVAETDKPQESGLVAAETPSPEEQTAAETTTSQKEKAADEMPSQGVKAEDETPAVAAEVAEKVVSPASQTDSKQVIEAPSNQEKITEPVAKTAEIEAPGVAAEPEMSPETAAETAEGEEENANSLASQTTQNRKPPADPILLDISFESTANKSEMVFFKLNDFYPPIVFGIEKGNPRVVCDYLDTALAQEVPPEIITKGKYVSRIRTAKHKGPDKVRVVLDLIPSRNYDLQQVFFKEDNLFVIIINELKSKAAPLSDTPTNSGSTP